MITLIIYQNVINTSKRKSALMVILAKKYLIVINYYQVVH